LTKPRPLDDLRSMNRRRIILIGAAILVVAAVGLVSVARTLRQPTAIAVMREQLQELRAATDSCHASLANRQRALLAYNERLDSMRVRVREMEGLHPRGVPADSYPAYMQVFESYNDSAAAWEGRVAELQAERDECAAVTAAHNEAADSLRDLLLEQRR
jgi:hypothetical protein